MQGLEKSLFQCDRPKYASKFRTPLKELALSVEHAYKGSQHIGYIFRELRDVSSTEPTRPGARADKFNKAVWAEDYKEYQVKKRKLEELKSMAYALVLGQCSPIIITELEGQEKYATIKNILDLV